MSKVLNLCQISFIITLLLQLCNDTVGDWENITFFVGYVFFQHFKHRNGTVFHCEAQLVIGNCAQISAVVWQLHHSAPPLWSSGGIRENV